MPVGGEITGCGKTQCDADSSSDDLCDEVVDRNCAWGEESLGELDACSDGGAAKQYQCGCYEGRASKCRIALQPCDGEVTQRDIQKNIRDPIGTRLHTEFKVGDTKKLLPSFSKREFPDLEQNQAAVNDNTQE